jgi:hypothetical protein
MIIPQIYVVSYAFNDSLSIVSVDDSFVGAFFFRVPGITVFFFLLHFHPYICTYVVVFVHVTRFVTHMLPFLCAVCSFSGRRQYSIFHTFCVDHFMCFPFNVTHKMVL